MEKKIKAAISAVLYYIKSEQRKSLENKWSLSGRQTIMDNRRIVQSKIIKR